MLFLGRVVVSSLFPITLQGSLVFRRINKLCHLTTTQRERRKNIVLLLVSASFLGHATRRANRLRHSFLSSLTVTHDTKVSHGGYIIIIIVENCSIVICTYTSTNAIVSHNSNKDEQVLLFFLNLDNSSVFVDILALLCRQS